MLRDLSYVVDRRGGDAGLLESAEDVRLPFAFDPFADQLRQLLASRDPIGIGCEPWIRGEREPWE